MSSPAYKNVGIASLIMMGSVFLSRVVGLLREMSIAYVGGAGHEVDAYQIAFILPEVLNHILASGFLSVTFIPIFTRHLVEQREDEAWRSFSIILCVFGAGAVAGTAVAMVFAPLLVSLAAPGLQETDVFEAAVRMTRIILPAQIAFFAGGLLMAVQFARGRFFLPALAPLIYNLGIIAGGLLLRPWLGVEGFAWGVLVGAFLGNFAVQLAGARRLGLRFRPAWSWTHPDLKEYVRLTLPLMLGLTMTFSTEFLFRCFGSYLPAGGIAVLNFSLRVMLILVGLFGQAVGIASFPTMARLAAENNLPELNRLLNRTLRYLALLIPVAAMLMVLSREVVRILFQRGRFDPAATTLTAEVLVWFLAGAFAFAAYTVVVRGYYAARNTLVPALFGTGAVLASIPVYFLGMHVMGTSGIAAAVSLSGILQVAVLYHLWSRRSGNAGQGGVYGFYLKMGLLGVGVAAVLAAFRELLLSVFDAASLAGSLAVSALVGVAFAGLMLLSGYGLKIPEITDLTGRLVQAIQRKYLKKTT
ncbi:MAG TPA: murein biosynthesis integral membrane protein MurJ [Desulfobacterales bacterium]|nr:murein biosynthesis integral membrane protein MurJ [Desulfobacterales bacterium]